MYERDLIRARYELAVAVKRTCLKDDKEEPVYAAPFKIKNVANGLKNKIPIPGQTKDKKNEKNEKNENIKNIKNVQEGRQEEQKPEKAKTMTEGILKELSEIEIELDKINRNVNKFDVYEENTGYVVFLTAVGRSLAVQSLLTTPWDKLVKNGITKFRTAPNLRVKPAPEPRDIVHDNVGANTYKKYTCGSISPRVVIMRCLSFLLLLFWALPGK